MSSEHAAYHTLASVLYGDYHKLAKLYEQHGTWQGTLAALRPERSAGGDAQPLGPDIRLILRTDDDFPAALREIPYPPHGIYVRGKLSTPAQISVAIVGTRKATEEGKRAAERFATALGGASVSVVSGLAFGIDAAAHRGALMGGGHTVAVLGTSVDVISPRSNDELGREILRHNGAIISERPPGVSTVPHHFLQRNRIVSGLAQGIIVIEAPERSGSLATARFALEQNRQVFVLPGPATHPNFTGSHALIRAGAELVTEPTQVLEALGIAAHATSLNEKVYTEEERLIREAFREVQGPLAIDTIIEYTKLNAQTVNRTLSFLVIQGTVAESGEGYMMNRP